LNENPSRFSLEACTIQLEITYEDASELFTVDETSRQPTRVLNDFLSFVIISEPVTSWQILTLELNSNAPIYNFFSGHYSKVKIF